MPARRKTCVRKQGAHASGGLHGILLVDFVASPAAFFWNGRHARARERFYRISRFRMNQPHAKPKEIANIGQRQSCNENDQDSLDKSPRRNGQSHLLPRTDGRVTRIPANGNDKMWKGRLKKQLCTFAGNTIGGEGERSRGGLVAMTIPSFVVLEMGKRRMILG